MNSRAAFDIGPLSWVKGEIDASMARALQALKVVAGRPADGASIKLAQAHLHQAHGALSIVGLDGVTRVTGELEALLGDIEQDAGMRIPKTFAIAERAIAAIVGYLDRLMTGESNLPLRLFPVYRELVAARGREQADPVDLYFPDLTLRPPRREKVPVPLRAGEEERYFRDQRARFQRGLLKSLRGDAGGAEDMRAAVEAIEATQGAASQRAFWWAAAGFFDALAHRTLPADLDSRRMCNRIEQQIRRLVEGSQNIAERLMREILYCVARARPGGEQAKAVQEAYGLTLTVPPEEAAQEMPPADPPALKAGRDMLVVAKDVWNKFASGNPPSLVAFGSAVGVLKDRSGELANPDLVALAQELVVMAGWLAANPDKMSEAIALEVATALLLLENALGNFGALGPEFRTQVQFVCGRLQAGMLGRLLRTAPTIPLIDEMSRKAQERLLVSQVVAEMQANLRQIEQALDAFFRDHSRRAELTALERPAHQVKGALEMLGEARARDALGECELQIRRFAQPDYVPRQEDFETVAQTLSGLGFYIEALVHGRADFDEAMRPIAGKPRQAATSPDLAEVSVESQLQRQKREAEKLYDQWKKKPTDTWLKSELQKNLVAIQKDAGLVADAALESRAQEALRALDDAQVMPLEPTVAEAIEKIAPAVVAPAPSPETAELTAASAETIDAELLAVYLDESDEVLATVHANLQTMRANPADREALVVVRRGFHTLKGSGRMVGLLRLGEAAWAVERTLNLWLEEGRSASTGLLALVERAHDYFTQSVARLKAGAAATDERALIEEAERIRSGDALAVPPRSTSPAPEAPSRQPLVVPEPVAPLVVPAASAATEAEEVVFLGSHPVSKSLFQVFSGEARMHLATMAAEREMLVQHGVVTDTLIRATHTLAGICGTVNAEAPRDLAHVLERALQQLGIATLSEQEEALIGKTIEALGQMVDEVISQRLPGLKPELIAQLGRIAQTRKPASGEPVVAVPVPLADDAIERRQQRPDDDIDPHLLPVFLEEAAELVPAIGTGLRTWRESPGDVAPGQALQRLLHTLKGGARMTGAMALGELTHNMETRVENVLSLPTLPSTLFEDLERSFDRMDQLYRRLLHPVTPVVEAPGIAAPELPAAPMLRVRADIVDRLVNQAGEVSIARSRIEGEMRALKTAMQELTDNVLRLRTQLREIEIQAESQMQSRLEEVREARQDFDPLEFDRFTRFQELTRLITESVADVQTVHQNLVGGIEGTDAALAAQARLSRDLQQGLMRVRMVPFSVLAERLYRIVRQTAKELGKRVNLDIRGTQVELDRSVLERMTAPFEHMIRNAVTHGIELPTERVARGKPETGEIRLQVSQEGNEVLLALADDGRGLDIPQIREKALASNLMGAHAEKSDAEIADFIFLPGFTTATEVTEISGRGVGMDVVRTEVAALGGRIELKFERDRGTGFVIYLPLTLAVTQAILVKGGECTYAMPGVMVEQVVQLKSDQLAAAYAAGHAEWQGRRHPFHYLPQLLGAPQALAEQRRYSPVLFLRSGINTIALHVDEVIGSNQEIVVKAIGPQLQRIVGVSGATVLGSGEIVLIINPVQLALRATTSAAAVTVPEAPRPVVRPIVMVVDDSLTVRKITGRLLEREGYEVLVAKDGVDAMEKLQDVVPDVMLVDIEMPRMDGFDLTRNIRADQRLGRVPIIIITSRSAAKHQNYAREIGVNEFLGKPYQEDELLRLVASFVNAG